MFARSSTLRSCSRPMRRKAEGGPGWPDARIAESFEAGLITVERVRRRFVEEGFASALSPYRAGKRIYTRKLDGAQEAHLIALACSAPPDGQAALDVAASGPAHGRAGLCGHALARDR